MHLSLTAVLSKVLFNQQLQEVVRAYPGLTISKESNGDYLEGFIGINLQDNRDFQFRIKIEYENAFPKCFPVLFEIGGFIPREADWHVYPTKGNCCVCHPILEYLDCERGITVTSFITKHVKPYLAHQLYRKLYGSYLREFDHGDEGSEQALREYINAPNDDILADVLRYIIGIKRVECASKDKCFCGSGKRFKHCHKHIMEFLQKEHPDNNYKQAIIGMLKKIEKK